MTVRSERGGEEEDRWGGEFITGCFDEEEEEEEEGKPTHLLLLLPFPPVVVVVVVVRFGWVECSSFSFGFRFVFSWCSWLLESCNLLSSLSLSAASSSYRWGGMNVSSRMLLMMITITKKSQRKTRRAAAASRWQEKKRRKDLSKNRVKITLFRRPSLSS